MASYTPLEGFEASQERDWPANLGVLDWDKSAIVFTKRSLVEFLKYAGVTVDTNWNNVSKIPRYATIGKPTSSVSEDSTVDASASSPAAGTAGGAIAGGFKPTRRVRTVPGGPSSINLFGEDDDESSSFPAAPKAATAKHGAIDPPTSDTIEEKLAAASLQEQETEAPGKAAFKPTRRVRENPGGKDSINSIFGDDDEEQEAFKPTRRVREAPGGGGAAQW